MLTQAQCDQYREDGYILVEDVLEDETLADLRRVTDEIVASAAGIEDHTQILDLEASHTPGRTAGETDQTTPSRRSLLP